MSSAGFPKIDVVEADLSDPAQVAAIVAMIAKLAESSEGRRRSMTAQERANLVPALQAYPSKIVLLAKSQSEFCGIAVCFVHLSTFSARRMLKIHDLFVVEGWRQRGVGRAIVDSAIETARRLNYAFVNVEVALENQPAIRLYEGLAFVDWMTPTKFMELPLP